MATVHRFGRCATCTHASVYKPGDACRLCGGAVAEQTPPANLWSGWRCGCFHCTSTLC